MEDISPVQSPRTPDKNCTDMVYVDNNFNVTGLMTPTSPIVLEYQTPRSEIQDAQVNR